MIRDRICPYRSAKEVSILDAALTKDISRPEVAFVTHLDTRMYVETCKLSASDGFEVPSRLIPTHVVVPITSFKR